MDDFTKADWHYRNAQRQAARSGDPLEVFECSEREGALIWAGVAVFVVLFCVALCFPW